MILQHFSTRSIFIEHFIFLFLFVDSAAFLLEEGGVENDPFGASSWEDELYEATTHDIDSKIAGGIETTIEDHPFIFSLRYIDKHRGGGSILTPVRGLTAAEHLRGDANPFTVMAGSTSIDGDENLQLRRLSRYLRHPNFDRPRAFQNNIAVLYWDEPFIFDDFVQPIALPPQGTVPDYTKSANVSGWGATREAGPGSKVLRTVSMPLVRNEKCNAPNSYNGSVTEDMLCAGLSRGERGACEGDR